MSVCVLKCNNVMIEQKHVRYCYECINKATGERHCLVCGSQDGANLIHCTSCPRAYHMTCIQPALTKVRIQLKLSQSVLTDMFVLKTLMPNGILKKVCLDFPLFQWMVL